MPSSTQRNTRLGAGLALSLTLRLHAFPHFVENGLALFQFYTTMSMRSKSTRSAPPRKIRAVRRMSIIIYIIYGKSQMYRPCGASLCSPQLLFTPLCTYNALVKHTSHIMVQFIHNTGLYCFLLSKFFSGSNRGGGGGAFRLMSNRYGPEN